MPKRRARQHSGYGVRINVPQRDHSPVSAFVTKEAAAETAAAEVRYVPLSLLIAVLDPDEQGRWRRCPGCLKYVTRRPKQNKTKTRRRFCTDRCRDRFLSRTMGATRRAAARGAGIAELIVLAEVAERDGWRCHLCRKRVRMGLPSNHPESPTIDHLVPLSKGGDHTWKNVALAHRRCNSRRGAGRTPAQLRLLG